MRVGGPTVDHHPRASFLTCLVLRPYNYFWRPSKEEWCGSDGGLTSRALGYGQENKRTERRRTSAYAIFAHKRLRRCWILTLDWPLDTVSVSALETVRSLSAHSGNRHELNDPSIPWMLMQCSPG